MLGPKDFVRLPVAYSRGDGSFATQTLADVDPKHVEFLTYASAYGAQIIACDLNGDGLDDMAIVAQDSNAYGGGIPTALSRGDGTFSVTNKYTPTFPRLGAYGGKLVCKDFNGDRKDDLALIGTPEYDFIPIAYSGGDGTYHYIASDRLTNFGSGWCQLRLGEVPVVGDFNGDGLGDFACAGGTAGNRLWDHTGVLFGQGDNSFVSASLADWQSVSVRRDFNGWVRTLHTTLAAIDINGDGRDDLLIIGGVDWNKMPVAFSRGDGRFEVHQNRAFSKVERWAQYARSHVLTGDYNGDTKGERRVRTPSHLARTDAHFVRPCLLTSSCSHALMHR